MVETFEREKPNSVEVFGTLKPVRLAPTTITHSKALKSSLLNGTHTQYMSQLSQCLKILILPVTSPSSTLIEVDVTNRAGVLNILCTQCIYWCAK